MDDLPIINSKYVPKVSQRIDGKGKRGAIGRNPRQLFSLDEICGFAYPNEDGSNTYTFRPEGILPHEDWAIFRIRKENLEFLV
jgi:hypothetical protein